MNGTKLIRRNWYYQLIMLLLLLWARGRSKSHGLLLTGAPKRESSYNSSCVRCSVISRAFVTNQKSVLSLLNPNQYFQSTTALLYPLSNLGLYFCLRFCIHICLLKQDSASVGTIFRSSSTAVIDQAALRSASKF